MGSSSSVGGDRGGPSSPNDDGGNHGNNKPDNNKPDKNENERAAGPPGIGAPPSQPETPDKPDPTDNDNDDNKPDDGGGFFDSIVETLTAPPTDASGNPRSTSPVADRINNTVNYSFEDVGNFLGGLTEPSQTPRDAAISIADAEFAIQQEAVRRDLESLANAELGVAIEVERRELDQAAGELDAEIAAIDRQLTQVGDPVAATSLLDRRAELQADRDIVDAERERIDVTNRALAARDVYSNDGNLQNSHLDRLDPDELRAAGFKPELLRDFGSGYFAAVYRDTITGDVIVANRGTEGPGDWPTNFAQGLGRPTEQYERAAKVAAEAQLAFGNNVHFTGHSLGGGLAAAQVAATGLEGTTFNTAALHDNTIASLGLDGITREEVGELIDAYHVGGEVLNVIQDFAALPTPFGTVDPVPEAVGNRIDLPTINSHGEEIGFFGQAGDFLSGSFDLHGMQAVLQALNEYHARGEHHVAN